jgi:hypothetical protein
MVSEKQARELLKRWVEEINVKQSAENLDEIVTDNWVVHQPGRDLGIEEVKEMYRKIFSDGKFSEEVEDLVISGDTIVVRWTERSVSHSTGVEVCNAVVTIDRVREEKFDETWYMWSDKPWLK